MSLSFLITSLIWTGICALLCQALTHQNVTPHFAQAVWRCGAGIMALPWVTLAFSRLMPETSFSLPEFPDLIDTGLIHDVPAMRPSADLSPEPVGMSLTSILLWTLIAGWTTRIIYAILAEVRLYRLKKIARSVTDPQIIRISQRWSNRLGLKQAPDIALLPKGDSPFVTGRKRPTLYLPTSTASAAHLSPIIAHECVHIARGDLIARPLERAIADLLWFSPFAWLTRRRLDYWREAVCDAQTLKLTQDPVAYSRALTFVARTARPSPALPTPTFILNSKRKTLPMRISAILTPAPKTNRKRTIIALACLFMAAPLAIGQGINKTANKVQSFNSPIIRAEGMRITSGYGIRNSPFTKEKTFHVGTDIAPAKGIGAPEIYAPASGTVIFTGQKSAYGQVVEMQLDASGDVVRFAQLASISVRLEDKVAAGSVIGTMGESGRATGLHLHVEYLKRDENGGTSETPDPGHTYSDMMKPYNPEEIEGLVLFEGQEE